MTRDEQRTGTAAVELRRSIDQIHPVDPEGGGTWLGSNVRELTLALLNRNSVERAEGDRTYVSRGLIIPEMLSFGTIREVRESLTRSTDTALDRYRPFHLVAIDPTGGPVQSFAWSARGLENFTHEGRADCFEKLDPEAFGTFNQANQRIGYVAVGDPKK